MEAIKEYGFQKLTNWEIRNEKIKPVSLEWDNCAGWIYAYVAEGNLRYIGITTSVLRSRLDGYSYQNNDRVGCEIMALLKRDVDVEIYGIKRPDMEKSELEGEESELIRKFDPEWNVRA